MGRMTISLADYVGALDEDTVEELEAIITERRRERTNDRRKRTQNITDALNDE